jgi:hypothetical protein
MVIDRRLTGSLLEAVTALPDGSKHRIWRRLGVHIGTDSCMQPKSGERQDRPIAYPPDRNDGKVEVTVTRASDSVTATVSDEGLGMGKPHARSGVREPGPFHHARRSGTPQSRVGCDRHDRGAALQHLPPAIG